MSDEDSKKAATDFFEDLDYTVSPIPTSGESGEQRADLRVERGGDLLIVEAKAKAEHQAFLEHRNRARKSGSDHLEREVKPWNALSSVIEGAARQLQSTPAPEHAIRLLWACCFHDDWKFVIESIRKRLLGEVSLTHFKSTGDGLPELQGIQDCYYYDPADFPRYTILDGALVLGGSCGRGGGWLLINEFSSGADALRATHLHQFMAGHGVVIDPPVLERQGEAMAIRRAMPPKDAKARWRYLKETYGVMTAPARESNYTATLAIPREAFDD